VAASFLVLQNGRRSNQVGQHWCKRTSEQRRSTQTGAKLWTSIMKNTVSQSSTFLF